MEKEEKKKTSSFLLELQEALKTGKPNDTVKQINEVIEVSKSLSSEEAIQRYNERVKNISTSDLNEDDVKKQNEEFNQKLEEIKNEELKLMKISSIENLKRLIISNREELEYHIQKLKKEWDEIISRNQETLNELEETFKKEYGEEEFKKSFPVQETKIS